MAHHNSIDLIARRPGAKSKELRVWLGVVIAP
jgi:hypothetical protein